TGGMQSLRDVLTGSGVDLTGWVLSQADAVSSDGQVMVGRGTNPQGDLESWIAIIPEPATGSLGGAGLSALRVGKRRRMLAKRASTSRIRDVLCVVLIPSILLSSACSLFAPPSQSINIVPSNPNASVYVDGNLVGKGPQSVRLSKSDTHSVMAKCG